MNTSFLKGKKKEINLKSFHERPITPERDWLIIILISIIFVGVSIIISASLFMNAISADSYTVDKGGIKNADSIDTSKLKSALELIEARGE